MSIMSILGEGSRKIDRDLKNIQMTPDQVIEEVLRSGLRGRGGAGFPTGRKWRFARDAAGRPKYVICNADEGDPGAFMDRAVLEGDPHAVLEGLALAAYAIGSEQAFIYVREEYPIAVKHLQVAVAAAAELGLIGRDVLGTGFTLSIELKKGAGAFVCGEETALMASIEGKRGMPRPRPPFPAQAGLDLKPSNINNVETLANVPLIIRNGADWFAEMGSVENRGTKVFSLAGKVQNTGLVEVPVGMTLREIIFDIGGGIPKGRKFKAVQMGGPSGGCIPEKHLDVPVDYESLRSLGAIMGSGGMVVLDENNCMVDTARLFLSFTQSESCGKCSPCRLGTRQMLEILNRISRQEARPSDIALLERLATAVRDTALCGLGQTCGNPVLSTLRYFEKEYQEHISEGRCQGAVCEALVISACQHTCPVGVNVPRYVAAIAAAEYQLAAEIVRERNPFPAVCGRICHHPCEVRCRRGELDDPVDIRALKRFAADWYFSVDQKTPEPFPLTRKEKVAVVGAGPTGLTCAFFLRRLGYPVTVFEALPVAGGMLMVGVPEFRLPKAVVQREVEYIRQRGVEIRLDQPLGEHLTVTDLKDRGYSALLIAAGAQRSQRIGIPGEDEDLSGLYYGLQFLRDVKLERPLVVGRRVLVIGGGNVALDVARSARRLPPPGRGKKREVHVVCLESREEMPAHDEDVEAALAEGIFIHHRMGAGKVLSDDNRVAGIQTLRVASVFDDQGKFNPAFVPDSEGLMQCDTLVLAVGQAVDLSFLPPDSELERTRWERLAVDPDTLATNVDGIFAAGDFVTGPTHIIEAIAAGRRAAMAMDLFLRREPGPIRMLDARRDLAPAEGQKPHEVDERPR
ncbi:MAG: hydrogenase, partial [Anaerolineales bacterium]